MVRMPLTLPGKHVGSTFSQVRQGLQFIAGHELFRWLILLSYGGMFFVSSYMQLMPAFAAKLGTGETGYGVLLSATGVGSVAGTLLVGGMKQVRALGLVLLGGALASALALYAFAFANVLGWFSLALATAFAGAVFTSLFMISAMTVMQLEVPDDLRGRVMGIHSITYSLMPLGGLMLGAIATASSIVTAVVIGATAFLLITCAVATFRPALRRLDGAAIASH
jgi:predicted MFS family arabinose efflux permease